MGIAEFFKEYFSAGTGTIIDLTDPFINTSAASALFDIALSLYLESDISTGKLLVLDEAHKVNIMISFPPNITVPREQRVGPFRQFCRITAPPCRKDNEMDATDYREG